MRSFWSRRLRPRKRKNEYKNTGRKAGGFGYYLKKEVSPFALSMVAVELFYIITLIFTKCQYNQVMHNYLLVLLEKAPETGLFLCLKREIEPEVFVCFLCRNAAARGAFDQAEF